MKIRFVNLIATVLYAAVSTITVGAQLKIMPIGDSITQGGFNGDASYRVALYDNLTGNGVNFKFIGSMTTVFNPGSTNPNPSIYPSYFTAGFYKNHEGHSGWTTSQIATGSGVASSITSNKPDVVTLHLGTNDLGQQLISASNNYAPAITNLDTIVNKLRAANPNVKIALAKVIPYAPKAYNNNGSYTQVAGYNARLETFAASKSTQASPILVVDQYTGFDVSADHTVDGLHPCQYGEQKMADRFYMAVQKLTNPSARILCPLNINNASFEDGAPATDTTSYAFGAKGWVFHRVSNGSTGSECGFWNPDGSLYTGAAGSGTPLGAQGKGVVFFSNRPGTMQDNLSWVSQTIGGFLQDHLQYSLTVAVGKRFDRIFAGAKIELLAGDTIIGSRILDDASSILAGRFTDVSLEVNSDTLNPQLLGQFLTVRFSPVSGVETASVDFDNIRLTSVEIPEPASAAVTILGAAFIAAKRRRQSSKN
jgi:acyl-CoA thioesterase-1